MSSTFGSGTNSSGSNAIYRHDLEQYCNPVNKRFFAIVRIYADGLHVNDDGRVCSGEYEGIVVRNSRGKVLGVLKTETFRQFEHPVGEFDLAGNKLNHFGSQQAVRAVAGVNGGESRKLQHSLKPKQANLNRLPDAWLEHIP